MHIVCVLGHKVSVFGFIYCIVQPYSAEIPSHQRICQDSTQRPFASRILSWRMALLVHLSHTILDIGR